MTSPRESLCTHQGGDESGPDTLQFLYPPGEILGLGIIRISVFSVSPQSIAQVEIPYSATFKFSGKALLGKMMESGLGKSSYVSQSLNLKFSQETNEILDLPGG